MTEIVRGMKAKVDGTGVVFDIWEDKVERFLDTFDEIKSQNPDEAIDMFKCTSLPELEEDEEDQGGWRGPGGSSYGGGSGAGGYGRGASRFNTQSSGGGGFKSYGGESSYGGGRGGYGRGNAGGGGYGRGSGGYINDNYNGGGGSDWRSTPSGSEGGARGGYGRGGGFIASDSYSEKSSSMGGYTTPGSSSQSTPNPYGGAPREYNSFQPAASVGGGVPTNKVFANNLSYNVTEDILKEFFQANKVRAVKVALLRNEKGQSKGTAIIEFSSQQDADYVVKALNGQQLDNR